ncbi:hypothetical protein RM844_26145 [Streptomyces sp. DSM 44915]|uniref:Lipoprotein n=1 Tax=Streptomyces chisholmiae TaxID=3075540 RepID=A0ABU2JXP4_9ACTN|nr:hypothetical protein [Streptomyces sp. DSM 44915]MDT0269771.1 hypothetical protein [Streptomyces sp. DSM 44915]
MNIPGNPARRAGGIAVLALLLAGCAGGGAPADPRDGAAPQPSPLATAHAAGPRSEPSPAAGPDGPAERETDTAAPSPGHSPTATPSRAAEPAERAEPAGPTEAPVPEAPPVLDTTAELPDSFCAFPDPTMNAICRSALDR